MLFRSNARFDTYRSYAWIRGEPVLAKAAEAGAGRLDPLLERRIRSSIDDHLESKGYRLVEDTEAADFAISFSVGSREKIQVTSTPGPTWYGRYGGWYSTSQVSARTYTEGTLAIDRIRRLVESRPGAFPRYRQRLAWTPIQGHPIWVDDPHFDLACHVRHAGLPAPGDPVRLKELASRIASQPLDRSRPL